MSQFKILMIVGGLTLLTACGSPSNNSAGSGGTVSMMSTSTDINSTLKNLNNVVSNNGAGAATSNPNVTVPSQPSNDVVQLLQQVGQLVQQTIQNLVNNVQPNQTLDQRLKAIISALQNLITQVQALNNGNLSTDAQAVLQAILDHLNRVLTRLQEFEAIIANMPSPPTPPMQTPPQQPPVQNGNAP